MPIYEMFNNDEIGLINAIRSNGKSKHIEDVNLLDLFYNKYKSNPKLYRISSEENDYYDWDKVKKVIKNTFPDAELYFSDNYYDLDSNTTYSKQEIWDLKNGIIMMIEGSLKGHYYLVNHDLSKVKNICSSNVFLVKDEFKEFETIAKGFRKAQITQTKSITIGMISFDNGNFYVKDFDIKNKTSNIEMLDLHYGNGFGAFDQKLTERLNAETKGLTLFHGEPGTGKTTYLRHLIRKLKDIDGNNNILYFPPTMVGSITEPNFINFISEWTDDSRGKNYLLIEDAEPLLESRDQVRNIGITNLLNMTDGLLNDILNIQIIATFNINLKNIDQALLRQERLTARKEFKKLSIARGKKLAVKIEINPDLITSEMSLADIYSLKKESKTIIHDIVEETKKIGFY